jgi:hypothetical protein
MVSMIRLEGKGSETYQEGSQTSSTIFLDGRTQGVTTKPEVGVGGNRAQLHASQETGAFYR